MKFPKVLQIVMIVWCLFWTGFSLFTGSYQFALFQGLFLALNSYIFLTSDENGHRIRKDK